MEAGLAAHGYRPSVLDSEPLWLKARERAAALGSRALILVGDSRMQLDVDQDTLRRETGLEPVQLALNGTPFTSVLRGLAQDRRITGTVLVNYAFNGVATPAEFERTAKYEIDAEARSQGSHLPNFKMMETALSDLLHHHLISYADNAQPARNLRRAFLDPDGAPQYLVTLPDRSTLADYSKVDLPGFYYRRVEINLGGNVDIPKGADNEQIDAILKAKVAAVQAVDDTYYRAHLGDIYSMAQAIQARGGTVLFALFPESGYVKEIDARLYPRSRFWDPFASGSPGPTLHFEDDASLRQFHCPDGSHLDYHDRARFTRALVSALHLDARRP
jgi:hypothetical protein